MRSLPTDPAGLQEAYAYPREGVWLRANMISSLDGAAWYGDRTAALGSPGDKRLFATLRGMADAVIVGARTVEVERYRAIKPKPGWPALRGDRPPTPPLAIVSRRLSLDLDDPVFTEAPAHARTILLTTETAPPDRRKAAERVADVIIAGRDGLDFPRALAELQARGHRRLLCEGGPMVLARALIDDVLDELCLTISPVLVAGDPARIINGPQPPAPGRYRLSGLYEEADFLFLRYTKQPG